MGRHTKGTDGRSEDNGRSGVYGQRWGDALQVGQTKDYGKRYNLHCRSKTEFFIPVPADDQAALDRTEMDIMQEARENGETLRNVRGNRGRRTN